MRADTHMAERNQSFDALFLHAREGLSGYRIVSVLTAEHGLMDIFVFGGAKSSLRSLATPFVFGKIFIYSDNIKNYKKLNDIAISESFPGLRDSYARLWSAEVVAEFIMRTSACGGEYPAVLSDALEALRLLENAGDAAADLILCCFLWRMLSVMGLEPDLSGCFSCGRSFSPGESFLSGAAEPFEASGAERPNAETSEAPRAGRPGLDGHSGRYGEEGYDGRRENGQSENDRPENDRRGDDQRRGSATKSAVRPLCWYADHEAAFVCPECAAGPGDEGEGENGYGERGQGRGVGDFGRHLVPVDEDLLTLFSIFSYTGFPGLQELASKLSPDLLDRTRHIVFGLAQNAAEGTLLTLKA